MSTVITDNLTRYMSRWTDLLLDTILVRQAAAREQDAKAWSESNRDVEAVEAVINHQHLLAVTYEVPRR